jgi:hypothetical protein
MFAAQREVDATTATLSPGAIATDSVVCKESAETNNCASVSTDPG